MGPVELFELTARMRRQFPRNEDVLALCDEAERLALVKPGPAVVVRWATPAPSAARAAPKRDRAAYMREYRRRA